MLQAHYTLPVDDLKTFIKRGRRKLALGYDLDDLLKPGMQMHESPEASHAASYKPKLTQNVVSVGLTERQRTLLERIVNRTRKQ